MRAAAPRPGSRVRSCKRAGARGASRRSTEPAARLGTRALLPNHRHLGSRHAKVEGARRRTWTPSPVSVA